MELTRKLTSLLGPLYSIDLREKVKSHYEKAKSFVKGRPGDIGPLNRSLSAIMGCALGGSALNTYFYKPSNLLSSVARAGMIPLLIYFSLEFLGAAVTGRHLPIRTYLREHYNI